jgi:hypothetical protein
VRVCVCACGCVCLLGACASECVVRVCVPNLLRADAFLLIFFAEAFVGEVFFAEVASPWSAALPGGTGPAPVMGGEEGGGEIRGGGEAWVSRVRASRCHVCACARRVAVSLCAQHIAVMHSTALSAARAKVRGNHVEFRLQIVVVDVEGRLVQTRQRE